jgi:hypothetical protein
MEPRELKRLVHRKDTSAYLRSLLAVAEASMPIFDETHPHTQDEVDTLLDLALVGQMYLDGLLD